jgi:hypothetical protein
LPGDELREYSSSRESWDMLMGVAGFEISRDGKVIHRKMTSMN